MIECLSCNSWITPQIDFLLFLQNIRVGHFDFLNQFFLSVTVLGELVLPTLICAIYYWCIDAKSGLYLFSLSSMNVFFAQLFKMIACVYRPWILSDKIHPVEAAIPYAYGYSFPSGHSAKASAVLGGLAFLNKNKKLFAICLVLLALLVGFSRLWLGVHTPQDVVVGLLIGFSLVFIFNTVINWAEKDKNRYLTLLGIIDIAALLVIIYVLKFNSYPADYIDGKLIVNPHSSIQSLLVCYGYLLGIINGGYLCRRFFPFDSSKGSLNSKILRAIIGSIVIIAAFQMKIQYLFGGDYSIAVTCSIPFVTGFFVTAIYPIIFSSIEKYRNKKY